MFGVCLSFTGVVLIFIASPNGVYASSDLVVWPFQDPALVTGYIWADFDFRLTATDAMKD